MHHLDGDEILTSSFDKTAKIWDKYNCSLIEDLDEHNSEISVCQFNYSNNQVITSSINKMLCDLRNPIESLYTFEG